MTDFHKKFTTYTVKANDVSKIYASKAAAKKAEDLLKSFNVECEVVTDVKTIDIVTGKEVK